MHKSISEGKFRTMHQLNTRNRTLAFAPFHRLSTCQHAVSFRGPQIWNNLPPHIRAVESLPSFKKSLKKYLIEQYQ